MEIKIVRASIGDAEAIRIIYADAYRENRELGFPASAETSTAQEIADWISKDKMWTAKLNDEIVGAIRLCFSDPDFPILGRLGVNSQNKRAGIGKLLMETAEREAKQRGCKGVTLTVAEDHPFLSKIYMKLGYTVLGPRRPQHHLYREIVLRKTF